MKRSIQVLLVSMFIALVTPTYVQAGTLYAPAVREVTEQRTMNARHWELADGSFRAEIHMQPIHHKAVDGSWQPISTQITASPRAGFALANETNPLKCYLPSRSGGWVQLETDESSVAFRPLDALDVAASQSKNKVQFNGIGDGMSLHYIVEPGRLKELITLNVPVRIPTFRYAIRPGNLTARKNPDNSISFLDAKGNGGLNITAPWMQDASGRTSTSISVSISSYDDELI